MRRMNRTLILIEGETFILLLSKFRCKKLFLSNIYFHLIDVSHPFPPPHLFPSRLSSSKGEQSLNTETSSALYFDSVFVPLFLIFYAFR